MKKLIIIAIILLFAGSAGAGDKPQFKKIWTYSDSGVTPGGRPPMQADDEYYVANDAWKFYSWVKNHPDWRRTADGNGKDQYGGLWFYIEVCKGCPLPYTKYEVLGPGTVLMRGPISNKSVPAEKPCHWTYKIIPEDEAEKFLNGGWVFENSYTVMSGVTFHRNPQPFNKVIIKKQVCP